MFFFWYDGMSFEKQKLYLSCEKQVIKGTSAKWEGGGNEVSGGIKTKKGERMKWHRHRWRILIKNESTKYRVYSTVIDIYLE